MIVVPSTLSDSDWWAVDDTERCLFWVGIQILMFKRGKYGAFLDSPVVKDCLLMQEVGLILWLGS